MGCAAELTLIAVPLAGNSYLSALCGMFLSEALAFSAGGGGEVCGLRGGPDGDRRNGRWQ